MRTITIKLMCLFATVMICLLMAPSTAIAQNNSTNNKPSPAPGAEPRGNIKALKVAFISNRLALTTQEAQVFWPLYNEKQKKLQGLEQQRRELLKQARDGYYNMADADMEKNLKQVFNILQQELDLEKTYYDLFKTALPVKKIALLYKVEKDFKKEVLKQALTRAEEE